MKITMPRNRSFKQWKREQEAKQRAKAETLTPGQAARVKVLVSSLTAPKPTATKAATAKFSAPKPSNTRRTAQPPAVDEAKLVRAAEQAGFQYSRLNREQQQIVRHLAYTTIGVSGLSQMLHDAI